MKTLKNHILLYDSECPMCGVYSRAFITSGMLDTDGRAPYQEMPAVVCPVVDRQRAVNEIALVDTTTGEVCYGIHSLFKVISHSFPILRPLFGWRPFVWLMSKLYAFISYNRKVIIPAPVSANASIQPSFSLRYRIVYLVFTLFVSGFILTRYAPLFTGLVPAGGASREYLICAGQIVFQGLVLVLLTHSRQRPDRTTQAPDQTPQTPDRTPQATHRTPQSPDHTPQAPRGAHLPVGVHESRDTSSSVRWDYLGNMMTISLAGSLLLLPALAAHTILTPTLAALYFLFVVGCMLLEHIRRTQLLGLGWTLSVSWTVYRMVLLLLLLL